jgi:hypothetical protein
MSTWITDPGPFDVLAGTEAADGHLAPYEELAVRRSLLLVQAQLDRLDEEQQHRQDEIAA